MTNLSDGGGRSWGAKADALQIGIGARVRASAPVWLSVIAWFVAARAVITMGVALVVMASGSSALPLIPASFAVVGAAVAVPVLLVSARGRCPMWLSMVAGALQALLLILEIFAAILIGPFAYDDMWPTGLWVGCALLTAPIVVVATWWTALVGIADKVAAPRSS